MQTKCRFGLWSLYCTLSVKHISSCCEWYSSSIFFSHCEPTFRINLGSHSHGAVVLETHLPIDIWTPYHMGISTSPSHEDPPPHWPIQYCSLGEAPLLLWKRQDMTEKLPSHKLRMPPLARVSMADKPWHKVCLGIEFQSCCGWYRLQGYQSRTIYVSGCPSVNEVIRAMIG